MGPIQSGRVLGGSALGPLVAALLLTAIAAWIYWPGITGPDLLDDRSSVLVIKDLSSRPELAADYIFGDSSGSLGRSVSMASFVLERLYLDGDIAGSKRINIILHLVNGGLAIWLFWLLFRFLAIPGYRGLAVVLGAIWLLHPLLVSTVLYVVQRMAMLSTLFMLLSMISYIYWRIALGEGRGSLLRFLPVVLFFGIGMLAKENTIVLVPTLLLMEVLWFGCKRAGGETIRWLQRLSYGLIATGTVGVLFFLVLRWDWLAQRLYRRPFTLQERLLTESRIVWDYVSQLINPQVSRMGLYHDDLVLSQSLFQPVTTLYATLAWAGLLAACVVLLRWRGGRWLVFGIAWFVVGHSVESTVLSLELYYEHRNYYPAIGLMISLGAVFAMLVKRWPEPRGALLAILAVCALVLSGLTGSQVQIWSHRSLLLMHHLNGHPESGRANIDMAVEMARLGELEAALPYSEAAHRGSALGGGSNERVGDYQVRDLALHCIANEPPTRAQIDRLGTDEPRRPLGSVSTLLTLVRLLQDEMCPGFDRVYFADRLAAMYLGEGAPARASPNIYSNLAVLENALARYDNAYAYIEKYLSKHRRNKRGLLMKLHFATALGKRDAADEVIGVLQGMDSRGKLTVREQQTLALYVQSRHPEKES